MSEQEEDLEEAPKKSSKKPLLLGFLAALIGGGGGFYATYSGMILGGESHGDAIEEVEVSELADVAFVEVERMIISLRPGSTNRHLSFRAHLEVPTAYQADVQTLLPRVVDVLNGYLRALETSDLENPAALTRLRAQMLRRVQIVAGNGRINDLLITEFVLN